MVSLVIDLDIDLVIICFHPFLTLSYDVDLAFRFYVNPKNCANTNTNSKMKFPAPDVYSYITMFQIYTFSNKKKVYSNTNPSRVHMNQIQNIYFLA